MELRRDTATPPSGGGAARRIFGLDADQARDRPRARRRPAAARRWWPLGRAAGAGLLGRLRAGRAGGARPAGVGNRRARPGRPASRPSTASHWPTRPGPDPPVPGADALAQIELAGMPAARAPARSARLPRPWRMVSRSTQARTPTRCVRACSRCPESGPGRSSTWPCARCATRMPSRPAISCCATPSAGSARRRPARAEAWRPWRAYAAMHIWTASAQDRSGRLTT